MSFCYVCKIAAASKNKSVKQLISGQLEQGGGGTSKGGKKTSGGSGTVGKILTTSPSHYTGKPDNWRKANMFQEANRLKDELDQKQLNDKIAINEVAKQKKKDNTEPEPVTTAQPPLEDKATDSKPPPAS
jgi:hypothetical protein